MKVRILVPAVILVLASVIGATPAQARMRDGVGPGRALITGVDHFQACRANCNVMKGFVRTSGILSVEGRRRATSLNCTVTVWQSYPSPPWIPGMSRVLTGVDQVSVFVPAGGSATEPWSVLGGEESGTLTIEKSCIVL